MIIDLRIGAENYIIFGYDHKIDFVREHTRGTTLYAIDASRADFADEPHRHHSAGTAEEEERAGKTRKIFSGAF